MTTIRVACLLTLLLSNASQAQTLDKAKLDQFFDRLAAKNKAMGSLAIVKDGNVLYTRAIGYSQVAETDKRPLTATSRFRIGSITKMFTATMIFQLVDDGKLKLTDTLDKFFPEIANAEKITIAQILAHRSGIHDAIMDRNLRPGPKTMAITKEEFVELIVKGGTDFEPDAKHSYCNSGYFLLSLIVEKVDGISYEEALKKRITSKIGLGDTYTATGNIDLNKNESLTYMNFGREWMPVAETHPSLLFGAGAIISTPSDLSKFIQALFDGKLISPDRLPLMQKVRDGDGLGMEPFTFAGKTFYGHTGGADNYGAWLAYLPEEKLAVAYTSNAKVYPVKNIMDGAIDIYYHRPFQLPDFESMVVSPEILDKYVGVYKAPNRPVRLTITRDDTTLLFQPGRESSIPLEATAQDKFKNDTALLVLEFDAAKNQMTMKRRGMTIVFTKE